MSSGIMETQMQNEWEDKMESLRKENKVRSKIKITVYKDTGKLDQVFYDESIYYEPFQNVHIQKDMESHYGFLKYLNYTLEIRDPEDTMFNGRLILNSKIN